MYCGRACLLNLELEIQLRLQQVHGVGRGHAPASRTSWGVSGAPPAARWLSEAVTEAASRAGCTLGGLPRAASARPGQSAPLGPRYSATPSKGLALDRGVHGSMAA